MSKSEEQLAMHLQGEEFLEEKKPNDDDKVMLEPGVWQLPNGMVELELADDVCKDLDQIMKEKGFQNYDDTLNFLMTEYEKYHGPTFQQ